MADNHQNNRLLQVYKASAGSGKTYQLAYNYIKYLFLAQESFIRDAVFTSNFNSNRWYNNAHRTILAVTFTNKSTDEMKKRILDYLFKLANNDFDDYIAKLRVDCPFLKDADPDIFSVTAGKLLSDILQDFPSFRVSTIDSFFQSIVRSFAHELNIDMNYRVELETDAIIEEATDNMLNEKVNSEEFLRWMLTFSQDNISDGKSWNIRNDIIALKNIINQEAFRMEIQDNKSLDINSLSLLKKKIQISKDNYKAKVAEACEELQNEKPTISDLKIKANLKKQILELCDVKDNPDKFSIKKSLQEAIENNDNGSWYTKTDLKYLDDAYVSKIRLLINNVLELVSEDSEEKIKYNTLNEIGRNIYILGITQSLQENINQVCLENDCVILSTTNEFIQKIIDKSDVPFIYEKIGSSIHHYMIDEFQDTSQLQWKNFVPLLKEAFSQNYESLIVGDVKQSIYRWRNGDWNILNNIGKGNDFKDEADIVNIQSLDNNFRSAKNIVEFNNFIFSELPKKIDADNGLLKPLTSIYKEDETKQNAKADSEGFVSCCFITPDKENRFVDVALDKMVENIDALHNNNVSYSKMAIIVRRNSEGNSVANRLLQEGIPFYSADALRTAENNAVKFILSMVEFTTNMNDNLFRANLLIDTYYLLNKNIEDIDWTLVSLNSTDEWLRAWLKIFFEKNITHTINVKIEKIKEISKMSLLPMVQNIDKFFDLTNLDGGKHYLYIQSLIDNINTFYDKFKYHNISNFLKYWKEKSDNISITMPNANDAVQIITIHKSKGLEFDAVFLPFINFKASKTNIVEQFHKEYLFTDFEKNKVILNINNKKLENSKFKDLYNKNVFDKLTDMLNIFYVATTRPKKYLFINFENKSNSLGEIILNIFETDEGKKLMEQNADTYTLGVLENNDVQDKQKDEVRYLDINYYSNINNNLFVTKERRNLSDEERIKIQHGIIMHGIFEKIKYFSDIDNVVNQFCADGIIEDKQRIYSYIEEIRNSELAYLFKENNGYEIFNEIEIFDYDKKRNIRIDRLMLKDNHAIIIDYKFGKYNEKYNNQIQNYISIIKKMGYKDVLGYLIYFPDCKCIKVD